MEAPQMILRTRTHRAPRGILHHWPWVVAGLLALLSVWWFLSFTAEQIRRGMATGLDIAVTVSMLVATIISSVALGIVWWKWRIYRRPDERGHRAGGLAVWLFARDALLYLMLVILTLSEALFGLFAMTVPSSPAQESEPILGFMTLSMMLIVMGLAACNLVIGIAAFRRMGGKE